MFFVHLFKTAGVLLYPMGYSEKVDHQTHPWLAGWVIPGGRDIDPKFYNQPDQGSKFEGREASDRWWFTRHTIDNVDSRMPILGICYGFQILNCLFGGDMIQDLPGAQKNHYRFNQMELIGGESWLTKALPGATHMVGSCSHHQALGKIPDCFKVVAIDCRQGIPHAFEYVGTPKREIYACIWHPEYTFIDTRHTHTDPDNIAIFEWYIQRCKVFSEEFRTEPKVDPVPSQATKSQETAASTANLGEVKESTQAVTGTGGHQSQLANQSEYF